MHQKGGNIMRIAQGNAELPPFYLLYVNFETERWALSERARHLPRHLLERACSTSPTASPETEPHDRRCP
jgi:hypothetical protein